MDPGAGLQKGRDQRVKSGLETAGAVGSEAQKISQDRREDAQGDNAGAIHRDCGLRIADCGKIEELLKVVSPFFPQSGFRNPKLSAPIAIG